MVRRPLNRVGLTLLELLVVLVILAVVATVAVNSLQPQVETARFEQTRRLLDNIQNSVAGTRQMQQADGTPLISGFVADVGRLPKRETGVNPGVSLQDTNELELRELWDTQSVLARNYPFAFRAGPAQPVDYSSIQLPCGWRGPYLHLPLGYQSLRDPWGRSFNLQTDNDGQILAAGWEPMPPYESPLTRDLTIAKVSVTGTLNFGQSVPSIVDVVLLIPDPDSSLTELSVMADENPGLAQFLFSQVPIGLRALHIRYDDRQLTKYIHVTHGGLSLAIDAEQPAAAQSNTEQSSSEQSSGDQVPNTQTPQG